MNTDFWFVFPHIQTERRLCKYGLCIQSVYKKTQTRKICFRALLHGEKLLKCKFTLLFLYFVVFLYFKFMLGLL